MSNLDKFIEQRIAELNAADVEFCKDRWDRPELHPLQKQMAREESNKVTFARQELEAILLKSKQLQKEEPKTYTPLEAANEYHKEKGVLPPNDEHSWYVIAVNDYLKRTKTYTQEQYDAEYWRGWHDYGESL